MKSRFALWGEDEDAGPPSWRPGSQLLAITYSCGHPGAVPERNIQYTPRGEWASEQPCPHFCTRPPQPFVDIPGTLRRGPATFVLRGKIPEKDARVVAPLLNDVPRIVADPRAATATWHLFVAHAFSIRAPLLTAGYHFWRSENEHEDNPFTAESPIEATEQQRGYDAGAGMWKRIDPANLFLEVDLLRRLGANPMGKSFAPLPRAVLPDALDRIREWEEANRSVGLADHAARACQVIERALSRARSPYVSFSGGKDSIAMLALVRAVYPEVPIIWSDDELEYPETVSLMDEMADIYGDQFTIWGGFAEHAGWFRPWSEEPFFREPLPFTFNIGMSMERYADEDGYDLTFLGLRAEESKARATNYDERGMLYRRGEYRTLVCTPMGDWSTEGVFNLIAATGAPLNGVYSKLSALGIEPEFQRVGPLPLVPRQWLAAGWPDLLVRLEARYGRRW